MRFLGFLFLASTVYADPRISIISSHSLQISDSALYSPLQITSISANSASLTLKSNFKTLSDGSELTSLKNGEGFIDLRVRTTEDSMRLSFEPRARDSVTRWEIALSLNNLEFFSGLTERVVTGDDKDGWRNPTEEALNLRGQAVDLLVLPTLGLYAPFYISSRGYSAEILGSWPGRVDFGRKQNDRIKISWEGPQLSIEFKFNRDPLALIRAFTIKSGPPVRLPRWAFRQWRWRDEVSQRSQYFDGTEVQSPFNSQISEDIIMSEALDIPLGVYWVDRPWAIGASGYDDFTFDEKRLPEPKSMIEWIRSKGVKFGLWVAPALSGKALDKAESEGMLLPAHVKDAEFGGLLDFTNPKATTSLNGAGFGELLKSGVQAFKLDRGDESFPEQAGPIVHDGRTLRELRNDYPRLYAKAFHSLASQQLGDDFALLGRAGYTGSSRYAAFWGGDISGTEWGLRSSIIGVQRAAIMGFPFWGSDTGGYSRGFDREVLARWFAFSTFTPIMEVGPLRDRAPWDLPFLQSYDREILAIYRMYSVLRDRLIPYITEHAELASERGTPIVRPLFAAFPEDGAAQRVWNGYMFGAELLVYPVWQKGTSQSEVYLPKGSSWRDAWQPENTYLGGTTVTVETPLHKIPLYLRSDSRLNLPDLESLLIESLEKVSLKPNLRRLERKEGW